MRRLTAVAHGLDWVESPRLAMRPYNGRMARGLLSVCRRLCHGGTAALGADTAAISPPGRRATVRAERAGAPARAGRRAPAPAPAAPVDPGAPTEATLGFPIYPTAQFIASYDAGRGAALLHLRRDGAVRRPRRSTTGRQLKERGNQVFEEPPTHMFEVGRFRDETMAFPPGVTIKDWTWGGSSGYPNPKPSGQPARFPTIIMIVPAPPGAPR